MNRNSNKSHLDSQLETGTDSLLTAALESKPAVRVPSGFAAMVAARATAQPAPTPRRRFSYGNASMLLAAALLSLAMFALAPASRPAFSSLAFDGELLASAQLLAIACWLAAHRRFV